MIHIEDISTTQSDSFAHCQAIRRAVFCAEQGVPESIEWDGLEEQCRHFLLWVDNLPVATARSRPFGQDQYKIERVAVLKSHRGSDLGAALMAHVLAHARTTDAAAVVVNAQSAVEGFYARLGFVADGPEFIEADIPHVHMTLRLR